jgi:hypothetical protein
LKLGYSVNPRYDSADHAKGAESVDAHVEAAWRKALDARGRDWVEAQLRLRWGQPSDVILDLVYQEPYPTREYCQRWCAEQDNRMFHVSGHTKAIIIALVLLIAFGAKFIVSWNNSPELRNRVVQTVPHDPTD